MATECSNSLRGVRDRALILLGFAGALRRSELVGLDWTNAGTGGGWIEEAPQGLRLHLRRSKTNQLGALEEVAICRGAFASTCPVVALEAWRGRAGGDGPVFRSISRAGALGERLTDGSVSRILKQRASAASLSAGATSGEALAIAKSTSGHSLRAGLVTSAFAAGLTAEDVMRQTRHRDVRVLLGYRRHATAFVGNVSGRVGL
ncbi:site-specific integrase [Brevundimonas sp.]|uniref:site-specific integrase n=1 Tax=Brevundimonas sp. TaxID=1871086 RepID=UPI003BACE283